MFICVSCGYESARWMGKCTECGSWNSFEISSQNDARAPSKKRGDTSTPCEVHPLRNIPKDDFCRIPTSSGEFDRVLGGGIVPCSTTLVSGAPGIGKSTLLLQTAAASSRNGTTMYFCAEETPAQTSLRSQRLELEKKYGDLSHLLISAEYRVEKIEILIKKHRPRCVFIDSVQSLRSESLGPFSGRLAHLSAAASACCDWSQSHNTAVFLVAHVTKEGIIAGPKLIEHLVDTVVMFDASRYNTRFLYAQKNRHGTTNEVGILHMGPKGFSDLDSTETFFLEKREGTLPSGVCVAATYEGTRPFLVEVQSLVVSSHTQTRVFSDRIDARQISRIAAVLEKHVGLPFSQENIYVNIAGGLRIQEPGFELPLLLSLYSAHTGVTVRNNVCAIGEVSLSGEIKAVEGFAQRWRQAVDHGFSTLIVPFKNLETTRNTKKTIGVRNVQEAIQSLSSAS